MNVLVPVDGSPLSFDALQFAVEVFPDGTITVLHVIDLFEPSEGAIDDVEVSYEPLTGTDEWYQRAEAASHRLFDDAQDLASEHDKTIETVSDIGDPKRIIVDYASDENVDHIVIGGHGRPDRSRALFGSVAEVVARRTTVPVTLIR